MKRKTIAALLALVVHALVVAGCWDRTEVNDLAIITAAGLDLTEDRELEITVKIYLTSPSSQQEMQFGAGGGGIGLSVVRAAKGKTMADAVSKLQEVISRDVFWGQDEVFIFGERLARAGIAEPLDFLTRHPAPRERANVFVSKGRARDVLELNPRIDRSIADALKEMAGNRTGLDITLKELEQMMAGKSKAAVIPMVEIVPKGDNQSSFAFIRGTAVLKNGRMIAYADDHVTRGIMWLRNEVREDTVTVSPDDGEGHVSVKFLRNRVRLIPHIDGDRWSMTVRIDGQDEIIENTTNLDYSIPKHIGSLQAALENDINERIRHALRMAQEKWNADVFRFADAFYRKYPKEWKRSMARWDEIFPKVEVTLQTGMTVRKPGLVGKNIFKPDQR